MTGQYGIRMTSKQRKEPIQISATRLSGEFLEALFDLPGHLVSAEWHSATQSLKLYYEDDTYNRAECGEACEKSLSKETMSDLQRVFAWRAQEKITDDKTEK